MDIDAIHHTSQNAPVDSGKALISVARPGDRAGQVRVFRSGDRNGHGSTVTQGKVLRAGVIGTGIFGRFHAQKYASHSEVIFAGVYDADPARSAEVASAHGTRAFGTLAELLAETDIVSITTPASTHGAVGIACLEAGKHVYVEKPIATSLADADRMISLGASQGLVLQTGHQERLVVGLTGLREWDNVPISIECVRAGPFAGRALDVSVVIDLMIHDIDLVNWISKSRIATVRAIERAGPGGPSDEVEAEAILENGCRVALLSSRNAPERRRTFRAVYADGEVSIDFSTRALTNSTPRPLRQLVVDGQPLHPDLADSVGGAVRRFIATVHGEGATLVSPVEARSALEGALKILAAARKS